MRVRWRRLWDWFTPFRGKTETKRTAEFHHFVEGVRGVQDLVRQQLDEREACRRSVALQKEAEIVFRRHGRRHEQ